MGIEKILMEYAGEAGQSTIFCIATGWCIMKIKSQCKTINAMSEALKKKVEEKRFDEKYSELKEEMKEIKSDNKTDHANIFQKMDELPDRIIKLIKG